MPTADVHITDDSTADGRSTHGPTTSRPASDATTTDGIMTSGAANTPIDDANIDPGIGVDASGADAPMSSMSDDANASFDRLHMVTARQGAADISYRMVGHGPPLLLLHGLLVHSESWRALTERLARHYTCIIPDTPGLGQTRWANESDYTFPRQAEIMHDFIEAVGDQLGFDRYGVIASSSGATTARLMAADDRSAISALLLCNTEVPGFRPPWVPLYVHMSKIPRIRHWFRFLLSQRWFRLSSLGFGNFFRDRSRIDDDFVATYVQPLLDSPDHLEDMVRCLRGVEWHLVDELRAIHGRIKAPTRLVWGAQDRTFPIARARTMPAQFSCFDGLIEIDDAALLVHVEKPNEVATAASEFFHRHR